MKTAVFQMDIRWEDVDSNCLKVEQWVRALPREVELVVLPEMFATGFSMSPHKVAQNMEDGTVIRRMTALAVECELAIITSIAIEASVRKSDCNCVHTNLGCEGVSEEFGKSDAVYFNRLFFFTPDGLRLTYDKRHTFTLGGESAKYERGRQRTIIHYGGFRICPLVCYDLRFPVFSRQRGDYDILIYVASWPESRRYPWQTLLKARAIENQCYLLGANRIGRDPKNSYVGDSVILDFMGMPLAMAEDNEEQIIMADLSMFSLQDFRVQYPFQTDADEFVIRD